VSGPDWAGLGCSSGVGRDVRGACNKKAFGCVCWGWRMILYIWCFTPARMLKERCTPKTLSPHRLCTTRAAPHAPRRSRPW
jgi:hypothetical protein